MEREDFGAASATGPGSGPHQKRRAPSAGPPLAREGLRKNEEPNLPFWLVSLLFLGLPVTLAGILLVTWMVLFD